MIQIQIDLEAELHARLTVLAHRQGRTLSELARDVLARAYRADPSGQRKDSLDAISGLWKDRRDLPGTRAYVRRLRRDTRTNRPRTS
jgi:macrodomain Ter protein organizer (MatP/YcbG family)